MGAGDAVSFRGRRGGAGRAGGADRREEHRDGVAVHDVAGEELDASG